MGYLIALPGLRSRPFGSRYSTERAAFSVPTTFQRQRHKYGDGLCEARFAGLCGGSQLRGERLVYANIHFTEQLPR